jgi:acetyl esterase/lipase
MMQTILPLSVERWLLKQGMKRLRVEGGVRFETVMAEGVPCAWLIPPGEPVNQVVLYLHGGGFVLGQTPLHIALGAYLAKKTGARVLMVDYRLAPEHPFPAALDDCVAAYRWLLKQGLDGQHLAIAGDSAGGNLTLTTLMMLRDAGDPMPAAAACLSPVIDLARAESTQQDALPAGYQDPILPSGVMGFYSQAYVGGSDARHPLISPVHGDWRGLPPLLVHAGEDEILRRDALQIAELAQAARVAARVVIYPRMWHVWQMNLRLPQATHSLDEMAQFFRSTLG